MSRDGIALGGARLAELLERIARLRVFVVGDLILDEYLASRVERISPEAPVAIARVERSFDRLGGAANVAHAITSLGAQAFLCGVVGKDDAGARLQALAQQARIDISAIGSDDSRPTVRKTRVLAQHQQMFRMDWESVAPVGDALGGELLARLRAHGAPDAIILSDYAKGFLTTRVCHELIDWANEHAVPILVDPKNLDVRQYRRATTITPNVKELAALVGEPLTDETALVEAARRLIERSESKSIVVTRGEAGMTVIERDRPAHTLPALAREVFDVTGAGDTVIALLALGVADGLGLVEAAFLANAAAGVVVGKLGTAVLTPDELVAAVEPPTAGKVVSRAALVKRVERWRREGRKVAFTNGCYDLFHAGHLSLLKAAAAQADVLIVGINSDRSVSALKGPERPLVPAVERADLLAALECVGAVVVFDEDTPLELIRALRPDVLVKGNDYRIEDVVGREDVEAAGGRVALVPLVENRSTSELIRRIRSSDADR